MQDVVVSAAGAEERVVPCHSADPAVVSLESLDDLRLGRIPYL